MNLDHLYNEMLNTYEKLSQNGPSCKHQKEKEAFIRVLLGKKKRISKYQY